MQLFYVVYLLDADKNIVIPCTWIRDGKQVLRKFVNYGLNTSQTHLCFWSTHVDAKTNDGRPSFNFQPKFDLQMKAEFPCAEGTFRCRVLKFTTDYEDALVFAEERRERLPAVYNERRLFERPLPDLEQAELAIEADNHITNEPQTIANIAQDDAEDFELNIFEEVNTAMGSIEEINYESMEHEELIPCNQRNPVVLLEQVLVKSGTFEAVYDADPPDMYEDVPKVENIDPLNDVNVEGNATVKYEIIHDHNEVDYILDDRSPNELGGVKRENSWHMDEADDIMDRCSPNEPRSVKRENSFHMDDAVPSSSGVWSINCNVIDSQFDCGNGADFTQSVSRSVSPRVDCVFEVNTASFREQNAICVVNDFSECALPEIGIPSTSSILANSHNNHTDDATQRAGELNKTGELGMVTQRISDPSDTTENAKDTIDGAGIAGAAIILERVENDETDAHTNYWKIAACNDQSDDDVLFIEPKEWPKAKTFEVNGIVKRENDRFSGDLPFSVKVKEKLSFREYIVGFDRIVKVPLQNVQTCIKWSYSPFAAETIYDRKLSHAMLTLSHTKRELSHGKPNRDAIDFVKHLLAVRAKGNSERVAKLPQYIQELIEKKMDQN